MAVNRQEIERTLDDGYVLGWDATEVPDELQKAVQHAADDQVEEFLKLVESHPESPPASSGKSS
jgi:hypothetical protein